MTPMQRVKRRFGQAHCCNDQNNEGLWEVFPVPFGPMAVRPIGRGRTAREAWADAARNR